MIEAFNEYVSNYDLKDEAINRKYSHSFRVMELSKKYATILKFSDEDIKLATLIGLLHDIGRFEQLRVYHSFIDRDTIDHADYGVRVLFEDGLIRKFTNKKEDYEIIKFAIQNHNKYTIAKTNNKRMLMHAKLIRDTDKIDIIYLMGNLKQLVYEPTEDKITKQVYNSFMEHKQIDNKYQRNNNDLIILSYGFIFDINNNECLEELKNNYKYFYETTGKKEKFKPIIDEVNRYVDERMEGKC